MNRFDNGHAAPRPHFLDPPPETAAGPRPRRHRPLVGLAGLAAMLAMTAVATGAWLGLAGAIAWRVFHWLT